MQGLSGSSPSPNTQESLRLLKASHDFVEGQAHVLMPMEIMNQEP